MKQIFNAKDFPAIETIKKELKPNPNNWVIIDKWNWRVFKKYKCLLFNEIDNTLCEVIPLLCADEIENFAEIVNV